ncbi:transcriptional regulator [Ascochyta clinopodiicola]|nr:transcriptional regulator [Ascochyta clinopodiicola]
MGNSQPHTPLNLEEFPSLSGAPQAQQNTTAQQMWANPTLRTTPHTTIQRPQGQTPQPGQPGQAPNQQLPNQNEDSPQGQFGGAGDDYRFGGQGGVGQLSGSAQPQTGNIEEFPPLGNNAAGEIGPDRRAGLIQNAAAFGTTPGTGAFPGLGQTRNGLSSPTESQGNRSSNATVGGGHASAASRTPFDGMRGAQSQQDGGQRTGQAQGNPSFLGSGIRSGGDATPVGQRSQQSQFEPGFGGDGIGSPNAQTPLHKKLAEMTDQERYGLPGLLSMIPLESPDYSSLAMGQDLTVLGLDLSRPDNSPLHPTFGSPFVESNVKPVIPPDFTLPAAYTVTNVPPLHSKMTSFSAETLLAIFYQHPRDILQEIAAAELYNRDWRWHIKLQQWMMKDPDLPAPIRLSPKEERGWYLFFDVTNWRRERREFELNYDHLDQRHGSPGMADFYVPNGFPETREPTTVETSVASVPDIEDLPQSAEHPVPLDTDLSRDAIADLFHRVEAYEREHLDDTKDAGTVWVRVSEVGHGLTKTLKTMGSLRRRPTFKARLETDSVDRAKLPAGTVSIQPRVKIYEKPTRVKRLGITVGDCWKRLRRRSRYTGTELQAKHVVIDRPATNGSDVSFKVDEQSTTHIERNDPPTAADLAGSSDGTIPRPVRKDSKRSVSEQLGRRKSSLFLDVD